MSIKLNTLLVLLAILALAAWLRAPFIRSGMPYFYDEDEGHHYNRVVNMVKSGDFNPQYFLKPSLHFYLRMPVTAVAFLSAVRAGEARELKDIVTRDKFGLADYSFSASHPKIAKFNRAFSVCFALVTVLLTFVIVLQLGFSTLIASGAAILTAVSPALIRTSATIGVDVIVGPLVLATVSLSLFAFAKRSSAAFVGAAVLAGLATSTKYNAAIAVVVPLFAALCAGRWSIAALALPISGLAFTCATPYLLVELPLFLNHVAYEIWHYGIAGHVGNEGQPGIPQALHYLRWLRADAVGLLPLLFAGLAILAAGLRPKPANTSRVHTLITATFAVLYFSFMCSQKANFTRNMLVLVPFIAIAAMAGVHKFTTLVSRFSFTSRVVSPATLSLILCGTLVIPLFLFDSLSTRTAASSIRDSRHELADFLVANVRANPEASQIAVAGELQFARSSGVSFQKFPAAEVQTHIEQNPTAALVVLPSGIAINAAGWKVELEFAGDALPMRIVKNPALTVWTKR